MAAKFQPKPKTLEEIRELLDKVEVLIDLDLEPEDKALEEKLNHFLAVASALSWALGELAEDEIMEHYEELYKKLQEQMK